MTGLEKHGYFLVQWALEGLQDFDLNNAGAWLGQASEMMQNFEKKHEGPVKKR